MDEAINWRCHRKPLTMESLNKSVRSLSLDTSVCATILGNEESIMNPDPRLFENDLVDMDAAPQDEVFRMMFITGVTPGDFVNAEKRGQYVKWVAENGERVIREEEE